MKLDPARTKLLSGFVDSYLRLNAQETVVFDRVIAVMTPGEREATMPLTISWKEEGRAEGLAAGRAEGQAEGLAEGRVNEARRMLLLFGVKRLGEPSASTSDWLNGIGSLERLESLAERIADVETWDELRASLP